MLLFLELNDLHINMLKEKTELYLEKGLKIIINQVDTINRTNSGKITAFFSEINLQILNIQSAIFFPNFLKIKFEPKN